MNAEHRTLRDRFAGTPVLVVGGEGFLARNAILALAALNADVTVLVREQRHPLPTKVEQLIVGDMREIAVAREVIAGQQIVLNFAGVTSAVGSNRMPSVSLLEECLPHLSLIGACAERSKPPLIVFPSSRLVYGRPVELPVNERHPTKPTTVYGIHKLTVENYLRVYHEMTGLPYIVFRISNPYGPHQLTRRGYGILNTFVRQALSGAPIHIFGDGGQVRDFIFVEDLIKIMLGAIANPACHNDVYNVGGPEPVRLVDAAQAIATEAGGTPVLFDPWPAEHLKVETGDYFGDTTKLAGLLPEFGYTPLRIGIATTIVAYRDLAGPAITRPEGSFRTATEEVEGQRCPGLTP